MVRIARKLAPNHDLSLLCGGSVKRGSKNRESAADMLYEEFVGSLVFGQS